MSTVPTAAREYADLLLRLHDLDPHGEKDGPELVAISDAMDAPWQRMDGMYRQLMSGLSIDLYALAAGRRGKLMLAEHRNEWMEKGRAAYHSANPIIYLEHLRQPFPNGIVKGLISFFQG